jgi:hypothetical protein
MSDLSPRVLKRFVKKLYLNDNDIILVKADSLLAKNKETLDGLAKVISATGRANIIMLVVDSFDDISVPDDEFMLRHGWFRVDTSEELIKKVFSEFTPTEDSPSEDAP